MLTVEVNTDGRRRNRHKTAALSAETAGMLLTAAEEFLPTAVWKLCLRYVFIFVFCPQDAVVEKEELSF